LRTIQRDGRPATAEEQRVLARWSGWGAVPEVFDESRPELEQARAHLAGLMSREELAAAARNTLNAHYTDAAIVAAVWSAVAALGFTGGRVLEPGCGSGNFIGLAPPAAEVTGIELDPVTAAIAASLYPHAEIRAESFAATRDRDGWYDLVIGNVPFGQVVLHDRLHNPGGHSIHNHFICKGLRLARAGGLVAVLTSRYTMDSRNPAARREIAGLADLVGAVRLPSGSHQRAAGTSVVTDLLVLRRREPGRAPDPVAWERAPLTTVGGQQVAVNEYFLAHPDAVLGQLGAVHGAYRADDLVVTPVPGADLADTLPPALDQVAASARARDLTWTPAFAQPDGPARPSPSAYPDGHISADDAGWFTKVINGRAEQLTVPRTQAGELRTLLGLRDTATALLEAEAASGEDTGEIARLRADLNRRYDAYAQLYGPLNRFTLRRTGRADPATGQDKMARVRPPQGGLRDDPHAPLVYALEVFDPVGQRAAKAAIFTQRVVAPRAPRLGADTPADALAICLDTCGEPRLDEIARLLGTDPAEARAQLGTLAFDDPATGRLVAAAEYLSGNVRAKLLAAERAAEDDPRYAVNVSGLRAVVPADIPPGEIDARLGAPWIAASHVRQFLAEILDDPRVRVEHPGGQVWAVKAATHTVLSASTWGTDRFPAPDLAQAVLEQRKIEVRDTIKTPDGDRSVVNLDATLAAQEKARELADRFADWAWEDPARATDLARVYNDTFNTLVLRSYDGAELSLPGLTVAFTPRPHQVAAVARMIGEPAVGLFHEVGAGKTAEMIIGVTELRRLGLIRKPAIIVPNHMIDQFAREWLQLYPQARVLVAHREDMAAARRRDLVARCATGDWDGVIMSRSAFERIPLSPPEQAAYMERELDLTRSWLDSARLDGARLTVKRLQAALARAEERLKAKLDSAKDAGVTFDLTGIDYICIDEAHGFKNLRTPSNITDAAIDGSMRASDLDMKIGYLRRRNGRRVVTFATATPIANSVTEAYVMQRYLRPDLLEAAGISVFDSWAATFGQVVTQVELAPEGGDSFRVKSRFARFRNLPEMMKLWHVFADVKTAADLDLPVPALAPRPVDGRRAPETAIVEPSAELLDYVADLGDRADKIRTRAVAPETDNMLKVSGDGRRAALDLRLVGLPQTTAGKTAAAAERIAAIWRQHRDHEYRAPDGTPYPVRGSLQLVFCDLGTPRDGWNAYGELRDQLVARGLPAEAVRFVHDAATDADLARLFAACRAGHVAVLVGSTEKLGTGTNVQDRAIALHHLDAPWRPADVAQREGRIIRQGNLNPEVHVIRWITAGSFDAYMWQTLERKARFIHDVTTRSLDARETADVGDTVLTFSEAKALATGNPLLIDQAEADTDLARLTRAERAHHRNATALHHAITRHQQAITSLNQLATRIDTAITRRTDTRGDKFTINIDGHQHSNRADAGRHLTRLLLIEAAELKASPARTLRPGHLGGFPVAARIDRILGPVNITLELDGAPGTTLTLSRDDLADTDPTSLITRLEHRLRRLEDRKATARADTDHARREIDHAIQALARPFPHATELTAARDRVTRVEEQLAQLAAAHQSDTQNDPRRPTAEQQAPDHPRSRTADAAASRAVHREPDPGGRSPSPARQVIHQPGYSRRAELSQPAREADFEAGR
jgi:N12 class adenine-specific DNA methylase/SAM-dependent methyltransferase